MKNAPTFLALLLLFALALTGCAAPAAPKYDLSAGDVFADEALTLGMPMADVPQAWKDGAASFSYAGFAFTGRLTPVLLPLRGLQSDGDRLTVVTCKTDETLDQRQVQSLRRALERDYGVELQLLVDDPGNTQWYRLEHPGSLRLFSVGDDPGAQQVEIVFVQSRLALTEGAEDAHEYHDPPYDLSAGEICLESGVTLGAPVAELPGNWPAAQRFPLPVLFADTSLDATVEADAEGNLRAVTCSGREPLSEEEMQALADAVTESYGVQPDTTANDPPGLYTWQDGGCRVSLMVKRDGEACRIVSLEFARRTDAE